MKNISDIIEQFILEQLADGTINLSRNELASYFSCAPSQINYVITTRFTPVRGYDVESRRGGGGYIRIYKLNYSDENNYLQYLVNEIGVSLDYISAIHVLDNLKQQLYINEKEYNIIKSAISPKSLISPIKNDDYVRANILKNIIINLVKEK